MTSRSTRQECTYDNGVDLDEISAYASAATAGPWRVGYKIDGVYGGRATVVRAENVRIVTVDQTRAHDSQNTEVNIAFIARAHTDVPTLIAEVERLRAVLTEAQQMAQAFDTPRDAGRVRVFVGDLRHVLHKGIEGGERG